MRKTWTLTRRPNVQEHRKDADAPAKLPIGCYVLSLSAFLPVYTGPIASASTNPRDTPIRETHLSERNFEEDERETSAHALRGCVDSLKLPTHPPALLN